MSELNTGGGESGKHDKKRAKKQSTRVDMTPLVDLAFLLLTFFVLTSTFSQAKVLRMVFPKKLDDVEIKNQPIVKNATTFLLSGNNKIYYYNGLLDAKQFPDNHIQESEYTANGIRAILMEKNAPLRAKYKAFNIELNKLEDKDTGAIRKLREKQDQAKMDDNYVVLVKTDKDATYRNMIDVIDELTIMQVGKYFPTDDGFSQIEKDEIAKLKGGAK